MVFAWTKVNALITRRSEVQILPPPPLKVQVGAGPKGPALLLLGQESHRPCDC